MYRFPTGRSASVEKKLNQSDLVRDGDRITERLGRRRFLQLAGAGLGAAVLAACGGAPATPAAPAATSAPAAAAALEATAAPAAAPAAGAAAIPANTLVYGLGFDLDDTMDPQVT